jgi:hypothetical protein
MRRFRTVLAAALCVFSLTVSAQASVKRDEGRRDTIGSKVVRALKRVFLPGSKDDFSWPKP